MADERLHFGPCSEKQRLVLQDNETDLLITGGGAGSGKALRHGEKVITPFGGVNIEDIQVGDIISSVDGGFQKVTAKYPQGLVDIYRVKFQDGRSVDVCKDHLWSFHRAGKGPGKKRIENTLKLKQIVEDSCKGGRKYLPIVQLTSAVKFQTSWYKLPVDPYVLGVILGDGYITTDGYATIVSADQEIVDRVAASGVPVGNPTSKTGTHAKAYRLTGMGQPLRDLGLAGTKSASKFIPAQYKVASIEDRYSILQGLMDTDGYASEVGETVYYSVSEVLAKDVQEIAWSLGYSAKITSKIGKYRGCDGEVVNCQRVYSVYIRGENQKRLFYLQRKANRCKDKFVGIRVESVEYVGKDLATCISVSDESSLFLTTNYVVTHNSRTCLTKALAFINDPAARVLIVRLSYPMLKLPGGLVDESKKIYTHFGGILKAQTLTWEFPNGATITFKAKPDDITEWQGLQATHILVDEIAEFTEEDILFMQGRIRGADYKGHMGLIGTCNPSRDSFLYKWVEYSLDPATGIPMPGTEHRRRFFINKDNKIIWADSREELIDIVREKYGEEAAKRCKPLSFRYIPMTIYDNPVLLKNNPGYLANLEGQSRVNQQRYILGSWSARAEGSGFFRRSWAPIVDQPPVNPVGRVRSWDLAASVPSETNRDPDWTAGVLMSRDRFGIYYIEDVIRFRKLTDGVLQEVVKAAHSDGHDTKVTIPRDTGAGGKTANAFFLRHLAEQGVAARSVVMSGHSGKLQRFLPFCTLAESGAVRIVRGDWNEEFLAELECFENIRTQHDDMVDSTSDAFNTLAREISLPTMSMPDLSGNSNIPVVR